MGGSGTLEYFGYLTQLWIDLDFLNARQASYSDIHSFQNLAALLILFWQLFNVKLFMYKTLGQIGGSVSQYDSRNS